jgi:Protein phosphatase 2C
VFTGSLAQIDETQCASWLAVVREAIFAAAKRDNAEDSDYATTLLFAVFEGNEAYFWQLGDGAWVVDTGEKIEAATWPATGEYINETVFVTSSDAAEEWVQAYYPHIDSAIGFSDGMEHLCLDFASRRPHLPFVEKVFSHLGTLPTVEHIEQQVESLLSSPLIEERTDDDKTMVIVWRHRADNANG